MRFRSYSQQFKEYRINGYCFHLIQFYLNGWIENNQHSNVAVVRLDNSFRKDLKFFFTTLKLNHHHHHVTSPTWISDPLTPPFSIVHRFRLVFKAISCIDTELLYVGSSWSPRLCSSVWRGPQEYVNYELVSTSPAVSRMSGSSNLDSFGDGW